MPARKRKTVKEPTLAQEFRSLLDFKSIPNWLIFLLALIFLFRIPSLFEPYYYSDEMIYLNLGEGIKRGFTLYRDIHGNKPPLLYLLAAIAGNVFWFRAILAAWMMATTIAFWKLAGSMFPKEKAITQIATSVFAVLTTIPLFEGQIANAELFMIGPTIVAFHILLNRKLTSINLAEAGVFFAIATLFKVPSLFDIGAIVLFWLIFLKLTSHDIGEFARKLFFLILGFVVPIVLTFTWYWARGALSEYTVAAFLQNVGYLSSWRPEVQGQSFFARNAPLLLRGGIVLAGSLLLYFFRNKLSKPFIFATLWLLVSLFAATLSERPYPHYLIQVVPSISLLVGILVAKQSIEQSLAVIPLLLMIIAVQRFQFWHYPSFAYYANFVRFTSGTIDKSEYYAKFDKNVSRNYELARFIRSTTGFQEKVFVWGDSPAIYALSRRLPPIKFVETYNINDFSSRQDTINALVANPPKLIVVLPESGDFPELQNHLKARYIPIHEKEGARIWRVVDDSISALLR